jgi:hypothetical protein
MGLEMIRVKSCRAASALVLMSLLALVGGCVRPASLTVPLTLDALDKTPGAKLSGQSLRVYLAPISDNRTITDRIGENREKAPYVAILAGGPAPAVWLHDALSQQLQIDGVKIVANSSDADRILSLSLSEFWAAEDPNYIAHFLLTLQITDQSGAVLFSGPVSGQYDEHGHSLKIDDYQQCMCNAVADLAASMVSNPKIGAALSSH